MDRQTPLHPDLLRLAEQVKTNTEKIIEYLHASGQQPPSFNQSSHIIIPSSNFSSLRIDLNEAATDLLRLVNGPLNGFRSFFTTHYELAAYQVALEFHVFESVPRDSQIQLSELAEKVGFDADRLGRILRMLATHRVFNECERNVWEHTAGSVLIATDNEIRDVIWMQADEMFRAASEATTCIQREPHASDSVNSPFFARHGMVLYDYYAKNRAKGARFASAMAGATQMDREIDALRDSFAWSSIGDAKVVDLGGGSGHISMSLASQIPNLRFVVQDISQAMLAEGEIKKGDLKNIENRIEFMQHDFFEPQPVHDAGAFLIRQVTHNWTDEQCITLFRALIPALERCKPGTPILVNDTILPDFDRDIKTRYEERSLRQLDMAMFVVLGAKQRTMREFETLLQHADERFKIVNINADGALGLLEINLVA